eukprot:TRINITY_DN491_c0_g2_i1.p1 TRINITY_DN491_c0_g2~~TRINITY_DN491_c0_g2_i1.p1  ORF type:complete len:734 (-),score=213.11 TRINITY_DN491_c0_g2_i1:487-2688(-)
MDISQLLIDCQNPVVQTRNNAENTLKQMEQNLPQYLGLLMSELNNEQKPPMSRRLAGLIIKNQIFSSDEEKNEQLAKRWLQLDPNLRTQFKLAAVNLLGSPNREARQSAAQVVSSIATIELPENQWPELIGLLVTNVTKSQDNGLRQATLESLGYLCEELEPGSLSQQANLILTAIVHGMRSEETNLDVRLAAVSAMLSTLEFISNNMKNDNERNFIMKVICENTQNSLEEVRVRSFQCLSEIADLYYSHLPNYIQNIFSLTLTAITKDKETVGMQALEFWITICETELRLTDYGSTSEPVHHFINGALKYIVPNILESLTKQDEDPESEEKTLSTQAGTLLGFISELVEDKIVELVIPFVQQHLNDNDWRKREAATYAFGAILIGPETGTLSNIIKQALPVLLQHMKDQEQIVRDTSAWAIAQICELHPEQAKLQLQQLMVVLAESLTQPPKVAARVCHALHNLAESYISFCDQDTSPLSTYFQGIIAKLLEVSNRNDFDEDNLSISTYEAINSFICAAALDNLGLIEQLLPLFLIKLEQSFQITESDKRAEIQAPVCGVLLVICRRLQNKIISSGDRLMGNFLKLFATENSRIHEDALQVIGVVANCLGKDFERYLNHLVPFILNSLKNYQDYHVCSVAVSIISDLCSSLGIKLLPYCDQLANHLLENLKSEDLNRDVKPLILVCFGDMAIAIEKNFEKYANTILEVLFQAAQTKSDSKELDNIDWVNFFD